MDMNKNNKILNKWTLGIGSLAAIAAPVAAVVSCGTSTSSGENLRGQGSSSVLPIIDALKAGMHSLQYEGTGSGDGLKVGTGEIKDKDFGMTSSLKRPAPTQVDAWANNKIRTATWAVDAIGIAINLPDGITTIANARPIINIAELGKLYDNDSATTTTWGALLENEVTTSTGLDATPIVTGREGGKSASGTADGFWHIMEGVVTKAKADYNHTNKIHTTGEANSAAFNDLIQRKGTITYLSLGYALKNENAHMKVAAIKKDAETWQPAISNEGVLDVSYKWTRPFNIIYNVTNTRALKFAEFLMQPKTQDKIAELGFVKLTPAQINSQHDLAMTDLDVLGGETHKAELATGQLGLAI